MKIDSQPWLHNMSAPPRSHVTIAPHRKNTTLVRVKLMGLLSQTTEWQSHVLFQTGLSSWEELECRVNEIVVDIPPVIVMSGYHQSAKLEISPLDTVAILSRVIGNLYLSRTDPILSYERLSQQFVVGDPKVIEQLRTSLVLHS